MVCGEWGEYKNENGIVFVSNFFALIRSFLRLPENLGIKDDLITHLFFGHHQTSYTHMCFIKFLGGR